jgi:hypothetical protein
MLINKMVILGLDLIACMTNTANSVAIANEQKILVADTPFTKSKSNENLQSFTVFVDSFRSVIDLEEGVFSGLLQTEFPFSKGNLRLDIKNKGTNNYNYLVTNPDGLKVWSGRLAANDAVTGYFVPDDGDLPYGRYTLRLSDSEGGPSPYYFSAKND